MAFPPRVRRYGALRLVRKHQRLDGPVQRIHAGAGVGHVEALAGGVHDGMGQLKQVVAVQHVDHLHQNADSLLHGRA